MKIFTRIILNLLIAAIFIHGVVTGFTLTANLAKFYAGWVFFVSVCILFVLATKTTFKLPVSPLPQWFGRTLTIALIVVSAAYGWFWCAAALLFGSVVLEAAKDNQDSKTPSNPSTHETNCAKSGSNVTPRGTVPIV